MQQSVSEASNDTSFASGPMSGSRSMRLSVTFLGPSLDVWHCLALSKIEGGADAGSPSQLILLDETSGKPVWKCPVSQLSVKQLNKSALYLDPVKPEQGLPSSPASECPPSCPVTSPSLSLLPPLLKPVVAIFQVPDDCAEFVDHLRTAHVCLPKDASQHHLSQTIPSAKQAYFRYYSKFSNQMNMLQDMVRTNMYQTAILSNPTDFMHARVMDVGAGSGILSFFAAQAGADAVVVVEASNMASVIAQLVKSNAALGDRFKIIASTVEDLDLARDLDGQKVDVLVSEPIGIFLFNERMIESYLYARDFFLKPDGLMYPNMCRLYLCPFCDSQLYADFQQRSQLWQNRSFYGVDLSAVAYQALDEQFQQPVIDYVDPACLVSQNWHCETFDLRTITRQSLESMQFDFSFTLSNPCLVHGLASWFDILFDGSDQQLGLSTSPWNPPTHWYQIRMLFKRPLAVNAGQTVVGNMILTANAHQSYYIYMTAKIEGTSISTCSSIIDLKNPDYRFYTNPHASYVPPQQRVTPMQAQPMDSQGNPRQRGSTNGSQNMV